MRFTDIFIKRPVLAIVVNLLILVLGIRSLLLLPIRQYPNTENTVVTVSTVYTGADAAVVAGFITTPLEISLSQVDGVDYMTSTSTQNLSTIKLHLKLNYDSNRALTDINTKVNAVLNQLPKESQKPLISATVGKTIDAMYIGFYSNVIPMNNVTDYLNRIVQPRLQAIDGVQNAAILGGRQFAMRIWLDSTKLAGYGLTASDIATALATNNVVSAVGRTDGKTFHVNLAADTNLTTPDDFRNMVIKAIPNGPIIRLGDVSTVALGATDYDSTVSFNGKQAVYIGIEVAPTANVLTVIDRVKKVFPKIQQQMPQGLSGKIAYDATLFVNSAIQEVNNTLIEALVIVTLVIFLFLGSFRSVSIALVTIPLSLIGTFLIMLLLGYSINLLTLLAFVLAIGLVVDDAIIVVENIQRHMEAGMPAWDAAIQGARELANPIIAISVVLVAVYIPIGFMGGLTGALFTEFAFTLAGAVTISAVIALTLSPMMCSKIIKLNHASDRKSFVEFIDAKFEKLQHAYQYLLHDSLNYLQVTVTFAAILLVSIYFLYGISKSELAPQEDQGIIIAQLTAAPNTPLDRTQSYSHQVYNAYSQFPESSNVFEITGGEKLNSSIIGVTLAPWDQRKRTSDALMPLLQQAFNQITGAMIAAFQLPSLPGASGLPIQFIVSTVESFDQLNEVSQALIQKARASGMFLYVDTDLKIDKAQTNIVLDRDKASQLGLTMEKVASILGSALSQGYINYFNYAGRSYQVIPQVKQDERLHSEQLLNYYVNNSQKQSIPLSTIAHTKTVVVPESLNHFQQLNSATISAVAHPGVAMSQALNFLETEASGLLPFGYSVDYAGQSRQFKQESAALLMTLIFALIMIFLSLAALFESFRDPLIVLISVPMSICGAMIFISLGVGGASLNIYTEVGLVTLIGLISKHGILIVQFANDLQREGLEKRAAVEKAASLRLRPILMTTAAMVLGVMPLIFAVGAGAVSRFNIGLVIATGISIGTVFTLFVVPAMYMLLAEKHSAQH